MKGIYTYMLVLLLGMTCSVHGQWTLDLTGIIKKQETKKRMEGATINIYRNGSRVQSFNTKSDGKFLAQLNPDGDYKIEVTRPGHVAKHIMVSTKGVPAEDARYGFEFPVEFTLFEKMDGLDVSILSRPLAKIQFDPSMGYFNYDEDYLKSVKKELDRLRKELEERLKAEEAARKKREADYKAAIAAGDNAFRSEDWSTAKTEFNKAAKLKGEEPYPKTKLAEIDGILAKLDAANKEYNDKIAAADAALGGKNYDEAKQLYGEAAAMRPKEQYPKTKLQEIASILDNAAKLEKRYTDLIALADAAFNDESWETAKVNYESALKIKPDESHPQQRIAECDKKIAEFEAELAAQEAKEKAYKDAVAEGDAAFGEEKWEDAKAAYQKAAGIKPEETYPPQKIKEIDEAMASMAEINERYEAAIKEADDYFTKEQFVDAKSAYERARDIKPKEEYPPQRIAECDTKLKEQQEALAAEQQKEEEYKNLIAQADDAFDKNQYEAAKDAYTKASGLKPDEAFPKNQLAEIEKILVNLKSKDDAYNKAIAEGDAAFGSEDWEKAKTAYQTAKDVKPEESYPPQRLQEIETKLAELALAKEEQEKIDQQYTDLMERANGEASAEEYEKAKGHYEEASALKPDEKEPKEKALEMDNLIAKRDQQKQYEALVAEGDDHFTNKELVEAKSKFQAALNLKENDEYATNKIKEIDEIIAKNQADEEIRIAMQKKDAEYQSLIDEADGLFQQESYEDAKRKYEAAQGVKPEEKYPGERISAIDDILSKLAADEAKRKEEEMARLELEAQYNELMGQAEAAFAEKKYEDARGKYSRASDLKPEESLPKEKIDEIDKLIGELASLEAQYKTLIENADRDFDGKSYENAKAKYQEALNMKPDEAHPKSRIAEIDQIIANIAAKDEEDRLKAEAERKKKEYYQALIAQGDGEFSTKEYETAKETFKKASDVLPEETYPKQRISEIDKILDDLAKQQQEQEQISIAMKQKRDAFDGLIKAGDELFDTKDYSASRTKYQEALGIMPEEQYPKSRIDEIDQILKDLALKEQQEKEDANRQKQLDARYQSLITKADGEFNGEDLDMAIKTYQQALGLKPAESYPASQIQKIQDILNGRLADEEAKRLLEEQNKLYQAAIDKADDAFKAESYNSAKVYYKEAQGIKPAEEYPKNQLVRIAQIEAEQAVANNNTDSGNDDIVVDYGPRKSVDDEQEKEIMKMIEDMRKKREEEKHRKMQQYMDDQYAATQKLINDANTKREQSKKQVESQFADMAQKDHDRRKEQEKLIRELEDFSETLRQQEQKHWDEANKRRENNKKQLEKLHQDWDDLRKDREKWMLENDEIVVQMQESVQEQQAQLQKQHAKHVNRNIKNMEDLASDWNELREAREKWMLENDKDVLEQTKANQDLLAEGRARNEQFRKNALKDMEEREQSWQKFLTETRKRSEGRDKELFQQMADYQEQRLYFIDQAKKRTEANKELLEDMWASFSKMKIERQEKMLEDDKALQRFTQKIQEQEQQRVDNQTKKLEASSKQLLDQMYEIEQDRQKKNMMYEKGLRDVNRQFANKSDRLNMWTEDNQQKRMEAYNKHVLEYAKTMAELATAREEGYLLKQKELEAQMMDIKDLDSRWRASNDERMMKNAQVSYYRGEKQPHNTSVAKKNSQGVTEKRYQDGDNIILERTVVNGESADVYKKIHTSWGDVFYTKNGRNISEALWRTETLSK